MTGLDRRAVVLSLIAEMERENSWCGETHVQKCAYFLQEGSRIDLEVEFILYRHGPFSFELRDFLGELRGTSLLGSRSRAPYGASLFVTESGAAYLSRFPKSVRKTRDAIVSVARDFGRRSVSELEVVATAFYVSRLRHSDAQKARADYIHDLKPHISPERALQALNEIEQRFSLSDWQEESR